MKILHISPQYEVAQHSYTLSKSFIKEEAKAALDVHYSTKTREVEENKNATHLQAPHDQTIKDLKKKKKKQGYFLKQASMPLVM